MRKKKTSITFLIFVFIFVLIFNTISDHFLIPLVPKFFNDFHLDVLIAGISGGLGAYLGLKLFPVKQDV